ncbi:MAG: VWA domain-containing protein [Clostridiales bacterium]|nr:VWA domain-containing protein [Clostridiales bacterium]
MKRRIIGLLLSIAVLIGTLVPIPAYAAAAGSELVELTARDVAEASRERYTVLVLDTSGSMYGTPLEKVKETAKVFIDQVIGATGENYVALVEFNSSAHDLSPFIGLDEIGQLDSIIDGLVAYGSTNAADAFRHATSLLDATTPGALDVAKNIVFLSDGAPDSAPQGISAAQAAKDKGYFIYSLGFFHSVYDPTSTRNFLQQVQNAGYHEIDDPNDLGFAFGQIASNIQNRIGSFTYGSPIKQPGEPSTRDFSDIYNYADSYFASPSSLYNSHLATMSLCLDLSASGSVDNGRDAVSSGVDDYANKSVNAQNLLKDMGFSGLAVDRWFQEKPETDSIGVIAGSKNVQLGGSDYTLIALALRGGNVESEWASNLTMGSSGQHQGFKEAKENVLSFLSEYVSHFNITGDVKLWVTGYSRGGAVANLVGAALYDGYSLGGANLLKDNTFVYTFEAPSGADDPNSGSSSYNNIFNILNSNDIVPYIATEDWGFSRYGVDRYAPSILTYADYLPKEQKMLEHYSDMHAYAGYSMNTFTRGRINWSSLLTGIPAITLETVQSTQNANLQGVFAQDITRGLANDVFQSRALYSASSEPALRYIFSALNSGATPIKVKDIFFEKLDTQVIPIIWELVRPYGGIGAAATLISSQLADSWAEAGLSTPSGYSASSISATLAETLNGLVTGGLVDEAATLLANMDSIVEAHYPEISLAWLKSQDTFYDPTSVEFVRFDGRYRVIRINCPVDVEVRDSAGNVVASIVGNEPQPIDGGLLTYVDGDEKVAYIPPDESYDVAITATNDGSMTYMVTEESLDGSAPRAVAFSNVDLTEGDVFSAELPAFSNSDYSEYQGTAIGYTLSGPSGNIVASSDGSIGQVLFKVEVESSSASLGTVVGSTSAYIGQQAEVAAFASENSAFDGWYENGSKISGAEEVYAFTVQSDRKLTARFTGPDEESSSASSIYYSSPATATVKAPVQASVSPEDALFELGLFVGTGTDKNGKPIYDLDKKLTRLEALAIVIRLMNLETEAQAFKGANTFTDVPAWGDRYAAYAYSIGITSGINSQHTLFAPDKQVTFQEFTAFLLRVLGYSESKGDFKYEFAVRKAETIGLFAPISRATISTDNFLRGNAVLAMVDLLQTKPNGEDELQIYKLSKKGAFVKDKADWFIKSVKL